MASLVANLYAGMHNARVKERVECFSSNIQVIGKHVVRGPMTTRLAPLRFALVAGGTEVFFIFLVGHPESDVDSNQRWDSLGYPSSTTMGLQSSNCWLMTLCAASFIRSTSPY